MFVYTLKLVGKETSASHIKTSVINPRWAHHQNVVDRVRDLTEKELGTITVFGASPRDGKAQVVRITPLHFLEARALNSRGQEKFITEITRCIKASRCAIIRSVALAPVGARRR
jgi:hypothetical protein